MKKCPKELTSHDQLLLLVETTIEEKFEEMLLEMRKLYIEFEKVTDRHSRRVDESKKFLFAQSKKHEEAIKKYASKLDEIEETFFHIYTSIKRNQWLYATYPENWEQSLEKIKEQIEKNNREFLEMDTRINSDRYAQQ